MTLTEKSVRVFYCLNVEYESISFLSLLSFRRVNRDANQPQLRLDSGNGMEMRMALIILPGREIGMAWIL